MRRLFSSSSQCTTFTSSSWSSSTPPIQGCWKRNTLGECCLPACSPGQSVLSCASLSLARYLFALQVKRDLATGAMPCQEHTAVLLASYIVQGQFLIPLGLSVSCSRTDCLSFLQLRLGTSWKKSTPTTPTCPSCGCCPIKRRTSTSKSWSIIVSTCESH